MRHYPSDWEKRNQYIQVQKASFMSVKPMAYTPQREVRASQKNDAYISRDQDERPFTNLFLDSNENQYEKRRNQNSFNPDDARVSFQGLQAHGKQVRESENISIDYDSQKMTSISKSISQKELAPYKITSSNDKPDLLRMKSENSLERQEDSQEMKALMKQVKNAEAENERIKEQNIQLRLKKIKLSSDSDSMRMLTLRMEIQQLKKKIERIKGEQDDSSFGKSPSHTAQKPVATDSYFPRQKPQEEGHTQPSPRPYVPFQNRLRASQIKQGTGKNIFNPKTSQIYIQSGQEQGGRR